MVRWFAIGGAAIVVLVGIAVFYGNAKYREGQRDLLSEIETARARSVSEKREIEDAISSLDDDALLRRALGWVPSGR